MKIGIIGNYNDGNLGDEAILLGLKTLIKKKHPGANVVVFGKGMHLPIGIRSFLRSTFQWKLWRKPIGALKSCDKVILGGGGLFTDEERPFTSFFWAIHGITAIWLKKPLYCLGISVGKVGWFGGVFTRLLFRKCEAVVVRDCESEEICRSWGIDCELGTDLALALNLLRSDELKNTEKYVVVSIRSFINLDKSVYKKIVRVLDHVIEKSGLMIRLMSYKSGSKNDGLILSNIFDQLDNKKGVQIMPQTDNILEAFRVISGAEMTISMRLHAGIFSLICGTPFIPISYSNKVRGFWGNYSLAGVTTEDFSEELLRSNIEEILKNGSDIRDEIQMIKLEKIERLTNIEKYI